MKRSQQQTQTTSCGPVPVGSATQSRRGFTLVELLVVIAIIGVLVGMLAVGIGPVLTRVHEGAVTTEMKQIELAVENFKNQYGFYPPTFSSFSNSAIAGGSYSLDMPWASDSSVDASEHLQLLPFLNKISPNHRENAGPAPTPLRTWWVNIGRHLDDRSSLVFWLSGLTSNKQFPLTGGIVSAGQLPVAYGAPQSIRLTGDGTKNIDEDLATVGAVGTATIDIPRDSFFDFEGGQLSDVALDIITPVDELPGGDPNQRTSPTLAPGIKVYNTPFGDTKANRGNEYLYRNSGSYTTTGGGYFAANGGSPRFVNPTTFQIFTYGRDGLAANVPLDESSDIEGLQLNRDNITNFANGRIDAFDWRANLGL